MDEAEFQVPPHQLNFQRSVVKALQEMEQLNHNSTTAVDNLDVAHVALTVESAKLHTPPGVAVVDMHGVEVKFTIKHTEFVTTTAFQHVKAEVNTVSFLELLR
jgi:hypothetical protein